MRAGIVINRKSPLESIRLIDRAMISSSYHTNEAVIDFVISKLSTPTRSGSAWLHTNRPNPTSQPHRALLEVATEAQETQTQINGDGGIAPSPNLKPRISDSWRQPGLWYPTRSGPWDHTRSTNSLLMCSIQWDTTPVEIVDKSLIHHGNVTLLDKYCVLPSRTAMRLKEPYSANILMQYIRFISHHIL
jgi:hypothetical protein